MSKLKIERYGTANQAESASDVLLSETTELDKDETILGIEVSKKSLSIFRAMSPGRNLEERSGVDWDSFVNAMAEDPISFIAHHKGGAAWGFGPNVKSKWFSRGKIMIGKFWIRN